MLKHVLAETTTTADLPRLFAELGYEPVFGLPEGEATRVARWKGFSVVAATAEDSADGARRLARHLARDSRRALAVALLEGRQLSLAAPLLGRPGTTRVLTVSLEQPSQFAVRQLERLRPRRTSNGLSHALTVVEVLSSEKVGERFFTAFRRILERMAASLDDEHSHSDRRLIALLSLTRILFLYFVQEKGWLDGNGSYLRDLLDACLAKGIGFHATALDPLFFGTLNRPVNSREAGAGCGSIPYLNGGLFEPHPVEQRLGPIPFSNDQWREAFDGLFERFRFCVREAEEVDAIAPDMLGRVFERLMDGAERHATGSFYTPELVVRQLVEVTIKTALAAKLGETTAEQLLRRRRPPGQNVRAARRALRKLRVLDPAVGSGAFLLGALETLTEMRCVLATGSSSDARWRIRRQALGENLFGVDVNPLAVRLAELRLWLAVVADDPTRDIARVMPLPNLDGVVRQGDTLLDPLGAARHFSPGSTGAWNDVTGAVREARDALFESRGRSKTSALRLLRREETALGAQLLVRSLDRVSRELKDLDAAAEGRDLFGGRTGLSRRQRRRRSILEQSRSELQAAEERLGAGTLPFFSFEVHAPDVIGDGGFDVVIANPPWVRAERLDTTMRKTLADRFSWWSGGTNRGFSHQPDLSVAFLQRSLELAAPKGAVGCLLPSKIATAGYGESCRRGLVRETRIEYVHRVTDKEAAKFGATTYPVGLVVSKGEQNPDHEVRLGFSNGETVSQQSLECPGPWVLVPNTVQNALTEFRTAGRPLGTVAPPSLGVKTGADKVFMGRIVDRNEKTATVEFGGTPTEIEIDFLRPTLRGRDIRRFRSYPTHVLIWTHSIDGAVLDEVPPRVGEHLRRHARRLANRSDYKGGAKWILFRVKAALASNRVVWPDIAKEPRAVALDETEMQAAIPLNTCYVSVAPNRYAALAIAAVVNSSWSSCLLRAIADEARGGYRRMNARAVGQVPVPPEGYLFRDLADLSLEAHRKDVDQHDLDEAVAEALELSSRTKRVLRTLASHNG